MAEETMAEVNENPYLRIIEECDGLSKIESLQHDTSDEIYRRADRLLETYFPVEEEMGMDAGTAALPQGGSTLATRDIGYKQTVRNITTE